MKLASFICWIGIIISVIGFIVMLIIGINDEDGLLIGLSFTVLVVGGLGSWVGSFFMYGFGRLIDNSDKLVKMNNDAPKKANTEPNNTSAVTLEKVDDKPNNNTYSKNSDRAETLRILREKNLISEKEYQEALEKTNE